KVFFNKKVFLFCKSNIKFDIFIFLLFFAIYFFFFLNKEMSFNTIILLSLTFFFSLIYLSDIFPIIFYATLFKISATTKYFFIGIRNISLNWIYSCFILDIYKTPEIIVNIEEDYRISNDIKISFFVKNIKDEKSLYIFFNRIVITFILYLFALFYRFSIKSTFWFYIPLLFLVKTPSIIEDNSQKVGEFLSSLYETYLAKWRFILALVTLLGFIYSYFNYVDFMNLNIPFTQFLILFYIDISNFEIWRIFQLSIVLSTIFIFLGSNAIRVPKISNNLELKKDLKILIIFYLNIFRNWVSFFYFSSAFLYLFFYFDGINTMYLPMGIKSFLLTIYNFIMYKPFN
ncbi:hypothetical protein CP986_12220, partial [Arcobacter aquimarinus]